jgi:hypothetical protein
MMPKGRSESGESSRPSCSERRRFNAVHLGVEGAMLELARVPDCFSAFLITHVPPNFRNHQRCRVAAASGALRG